MTTPDDAALVRKALNRAGSRIGYWEGRNEAEAALDRLAASAEKADALQKRMRECDAGFSELEAALLTAQQDSERRTDLLNEALDRAERAEREPRLTERRVNQDGEKSIGFQRGNETWTFSVSDEVYEIVDEPPARGRMRELRERAEREPIDVDISDYSDEFCAGFLAGQANALDALG